MMSGDTCHDIHIGLNAEEQQWIPYPLLTVHSVHLFLTMYLLETV